MSSGQTDDNCALNERCLQGLCMCKYYFPLLCQKLLLHYSYILLFKSITHDCLRQLKLAWKPKYYYFYLNYVYYKGIYIRIVTQDSEFNSKMSDH